MTRPQFSRMLDSALGIFGAIRDNDVDAQIRDEMTTITTFAFSTTTTSGSCSFPIREVLISALFVPVDNVGNEVANDFAQLFSMSHRRRRRPHELHSQSLHNRGAIADTWSEPTWERTTQFINFIRGCEDRPEEMGKCPWPPYKPPRQGREEKKTTT